MTEPQTQAKKSDLGVRTLSAIAMLVVAGTALWLGGAVLDAFIALVALVCFGELAVLVAKATTSPIIRAAGWLAGAIYIGLAGTLLAYMPTMGILFVLGIVIATDVGAYFVGRAVGGPKIAPSISPSKTWAGLFGGMTSAATLLLFAVWAGPVLASSPHSAAPVNAFPNAPPSFFAIALMGGGLAALAQAGDFFESWLKRKAGVKDSSNLVPGHGGVFDRIDGLLPVAIVVGLVQNL